MKPSTLFYKFVRFLYIHGVRPRPRSIFYSDVLEKEAKWIGMH